MERSLPADILNKYSEKSWQWYFDFIDLIRSSKPSKAHEAILKFQEYFHKNEIKWTLVTLNYDNYHAELLKKSDCMNSESPSDKDKEYLTNGVYEIQGNLFYMRWFKKCSLKVYPISERDSSADFEDQIPKWPLWGDIMRPHILWNDENPVEYLYQTDTVKKIINTNIDLMIVTGTSLSSSFSLEIVNQLMERNVPIIDVNLVPVWTVGHSFQIADEAELAIPELLSNYL